MLYTFTSYESVYDLYVAILKTAIVAAVMLSLLVSMDRLYKVGKYMQVAARAQLTGRKPEHSFQNNTLPDPEQYSLVYPRVAVQLPMFNERAVCQAIIDSACELSWPKNRFKVQVNSWPGIRYSAMLCCWFFIGCLLMPSICCCLKTRAPLGFEH